MDFFSKNIKIFDGEIFLGVLKHRYKLKKIEKSILEKKLKFWNPYGLRVSHIKSQQNRRQNFFFVSMGGLFGVFAIFKFSLCICLSTLTDRNGQSDFLDCWNSGIKGCLNIKKIIWEQVLGAGVTFHWVIWLKTRAGQKDPPRWQRHSRAQVG